MRFQLVYQDSMELARADQKGIPLSEPQQMSPKATHQTQASSQHQQTPSLASNMNIPAVSLEKETMASVTEIDERKDETLASPRPKTGIEVAINSRKSMSNSSNARTVTTTPKNATAL